MAKSNRNIPNLLSAYRILIFPFLLYLVYSEQESLFAIFLIINLVTDVLDGLIARIFKQQTALGARLDSIGDIGTYIAAIYGVLAFKWTDLSPHITPFYVFIGMFILMYIISFAKFKKVPSLHLWFYKSTGYVHGIFFAVLFGSGFYPWLYYLAMGLGILAIVEEILVLLVLKEMQSNAKGLYWVLKSQRNG